MDRPASITEVIRQTEHDAYRRGRTAGRWEVAFGAAFVLLLAAFAGWLS